jgi:hypothetical protein
MKKLIAMLMTVLALIVSANVLVVTPAQAASDSVVTSSVAQVTTSNSVSPLTAVTPGKAVTAPFNFAGGGGGVKPAWLYVSCYWAMNGYYYCWRYGCTYFEKVALGCYEGWYRVSTVKFV